MSEYDVFDTSSYEQWLATTTSKKLPSIDGRVNPNTRKYNYEEAYSNIRSLENFLFKWEFIFDEYQFDWSLNFEFNFLIDLNLNFDLSFNPEIHLEFKNHFRDINVEFETIDKAYFDISKYDYSYVDPPEVVPEDAIKFARDIRKKFLDSIGYEYRFENNTMIKIIESNQNILSKLGIADEAIRYIIYKILLAEAGLRYNFYVGFAIVNYTIVANDVEGSTGVAYIVLRNPETFEADIIGECNSPVETVVEYAIVNYAHVSIPREMLYSAYGATYNRNAIPKSLHDRFIEKNDLGRMNLGAVDVVVGSQQITYLPARQRYLFNKDKIAIRGGIHQALMQSDTQKVKRLLDEYGIAGTQRLNYISFANEIRYLDHEGVKKSKTWKRNASIESVVEKYISLGANEEILWRIVDLCMGTKTH